MKKLLGIVVLGLLWCSTSNAVIEMNNCVYEREKSQDQTATSHTDYKIDLENDRIYRRIFYKDGRSPIDLEHKIISKKKIYRSEKFKHVTKPEKYPNLRWQLDLDPQNKRGVVYFLENDQQIAELNVVCKIVKKPKKKKPKKSPDDDKIVAAASGTGFFVTRSGHIVTNHHVIEGCKTIKVSFKGDEIEAKVLAIDKMNDLAIIKAKIKPNKVYSVSGEDVALLEDVIIAGFPLGKKVSSAIKTSKGSVTALAGYGDNFSEFQTDAALNQGNSGGPIMDQKGNVVGVAVANFGKKEGVESFNFGIKASTLKTFAKANELTFQSPNYRDLSNKDLGKLITEATVYLECWMTVAKIKRMIAQAENRKAFFSEFE